MAHALGRKFFADGLVVAVARLVVGFPKDLFELGRQGGELGVVFVPLGFEDRVALFDEVGRYLEEGVWGGRCV